MPGLVKVGKTRRSPQERAAELSAGVTGVPTPFIVVYEQLFQDCDAAEAFVHTYLEQKGHRVSDNREFFNAPANVVVRAICLAPDAIDTNAPPISTAQEFEAESGKRKSTRPWDAVFVQAESHLFGIGDYIKDETRALKLFKQAAKLGALPAYRYIAAGFSSEKNAYITEPGPDRTRSIQRLQEIYREGMAKGSAYCMWETGMLLLTGSTAKPYGPPRYRHYCRAISKIDADKCFSAFLRAAPGATPDGCVLTDDELKIVYEDCVELFDRADGIHLYPDAPWHEHNATPALSRFIHDHAAVLEGLMNSMNEDEVRNRAEADARRAQARAQRMADDAARPRLADIASTNVGWPFPQK